MRQLCFIFLTCQGEKLVFTLLSDEYHIFSISVLGFTFIGTKGTHLLEHIKNKRTKKQKMQ